MLTDHLQEGAQRHIYALRYAAYLDSGSIKPNPHRMFSDDYDAAANCYSHIEYIDGQAAGSIRVCTYHPSRPDQLLPSNENFSDELADAIGPDKIIVEASKFVINPGFQYMKRQLKFALLKHVFDYAVSIGADYIIGEPRSSQVNFYRHFMFKPISGVKPAKHLDFDTILLACPLREARHMVRSEPKYAVTLKRIGFV